MLIQKCFPFICRESKIILASGPSLRLLSSSSIKNHEATSSQKKNEPGIHHHSNDNEQVDFGFQTVSASEKAKKVHKVFEAVASKYDLMNDLMSAGVHRAWKDYFVRRLCPIRPGSKILDVAGGTGDIAFRMANHIQKQERTQLDETSLASSIVVSDINQAMLDVGKERAERMNFRPDLLSWLCADAQCLPLEDNTYDLYTIAFGIRNVVDIPKALGEAYRVLKPGGRFMCLEFSHVNNPLLRWVYDTYSFQVIPPVGELVAGDWKSYQYLVESIRKFPPQDRFKEMIEDAGFRCVDYQSLTFGVVAMHSGFKI